MGPSTFGPGMTETTRTYRFESSTLRFPGFRVSSSGILPVQAFFSLPAGRLPAGEGSWNRPSGCVYRSIGDWSLPSVGATRNPNFGPHHLGGGNMQVH